MTSTTVTLLAHQQRVVQEKADLDTKIAALRSFMLTATFEALHPKEQGLRHRQVLVMDRYSEILGDLIKLFQEPV